MSRTLRPPQDHPEPLLEPMHVWLTANPLTLSRTAALRHRDEHRYPFQVIRDWEGRLIRVSALSK